MVQLARPSQPAASDDVPGALRRAAATFGHRPAISLLLPEGRQEQSFASLGQWAAKTAHWLQLDMAAEPGFTVGLVGPHGWLPAAVALGAWWTGSVVVDGAPGAQADVVIAGPGVDRADGWFAWGHEFDGSDPSAHDNLAWIVQEFPDDPPPATGAAAMPAIGGDSPMTHQEILSAWRDDTGTIAVGAEGVAWVSATAARPLVVGKPTVLLADGVPASRAAGDGVARWL